MPALAPSSPQPVSRPQGPRRPPGLDLQGQVDRATTPLSRAPTSGRSLGRRSDHGHTELERHRDAHRSSIPLCPLGTRQQRKAHLRCRCCDRRGTAGAAPLDAPNVDVGSRNRAHRQLASRRGRARHAHLLLPPALALGATEQREPQSATALLAAKGHRPRSPRPSRPQQDHERAQQPTPQDVQLADTSPALRSAHDALTTRTRHPQT